jgi:hypothetical protein
MLTLFAAGADSDHAARDGVQAVTRRRGQVAAVVLTGSDRDEDEECGHAQKRTGQAAKMM